MRVSSQEQLLPNLHFDDAYAADVFHAALGSDRVIFIAHALEPDFAAKLPPWWRQSLAGARSLTSMPSWATCLKICAAR